VNPLLFPLTGERYEFVPLTRGIQGVEELFHPPFYSLPPRDGKSSSLSLDGRLSEAKSTGGTKGEDE
jgi:hypothetical protein